MVQGVAYLARVGAATSNSVLFPPGGFTLGVKAWPIAPGDFCAPGAAFPITSVPYSDTRNLSTFSASL